MGMRTRLRNELEVILAQHTIPRYRTAPSSPGPAEIVGELLDHYEKEAVQRAIRKLVSAHVDITYRYQKDTKFRHAINLIAEVMVLGVFEHDAALTREEAEARMVQFNVVLDSLQ